MAMLDKLAHPQLVETAKLLRREGRAGYQEKLADELKDDLLTHGCNICHKMDTTPKM